MDGSWLLREATNDFIRNASAAILVVLIYRRWKSAMSPTISVKSDSIASNAAQPARSLMRNQERPWLKMETNAYDSFAISTGMSCSLHAVSTAKPLFLVNTLSPSVLIGTTDIFSALSAVIRLSTV